MLFNPLTLLSPLTLLPISLKDQMIAIVCQSFAPIFKLKYLKDNCDSC